MAVSALGDQPLNEAARWVDSPNERGTFNIISNCILTLVLCVWTSIHLNIPAIQDRASPGRLPNVYREEKVDVPFSWKKIKYVILALIMPEVVSLISLEKPANPNLQVTGRCSCFQSVVGATLADELHQQRDGARS